MFVNFLINNKIDGILRVDVQEDEITLLKVSIVLDLLQISFSLPYG